MKKIIIIFSYILSFLLLLSGISAYTQPCVYAEWHFNGVSPCGNTTENDPNNAVDCGQGGVHIYGTQATANLKFDYPAYPVDESPLKYNYSVNITFSVVSGVNFATYFNFLTHNNSGQNVSFQPRYYYINRTLYPGGPYLTTPQSNNPFGLQDTLVKNNASVKLSYRWRQNGTFQGFQNGVMTFDLGTFDDSQSDPSRNKNTSYLLAGERDGSGGNSLDFWITDVMYINDSCTPPVAPDTTPPEITYYNLTSSTGGCESWNTNKDTACSTPIVTPAIQFNTSEEAWCAVSGNISAPSSGQNYTAMGSARNCTGAASGEGTKEHYCSLTSQDELVYETAYIYISCKDLSNNENQTSTSGALKLSITGLEAAGRASIGIGIQNALLSSYTNYTDLQIYARNLSNSQAKGTFDRAAKKANKMWAFNRIGVSDSYANLINLTPVLYVMEFANITSTNLTNKTQALIEATR